MEAVAHYAIEVKGGIYLLDDDGDWNLVTARGRYSKPSPVSQVSEAARSIPAIIEERLHREVSIITVLAMPDMEPDPVITDHAAQRVVVVLFGTDSWMECLVNLADGLRIIVPPTPGQIEEEVTVVMPNLAKPLHPNAGTKGLMV